MPLTPLEPEQARPENADAPNAGPSQPLESAEPAPVQVDPDAPLSFVPHQPADTAAQKPMRIRTTRFGELEEHEIVRLLDSIEDERARSRFRESVYISIFVWMAVALLALYGPRYLWHAPELINPADILKQRDIVNLTDPKLPRMAAPSAHPTPKPTVDRRTLEHLRASAPKPSPAPSPSPTPLPETPKPANAATPPPTPQPTRNPPPVVADAPTPQPQPRPTRPDFSTGGTAGDNIRNALNGAASDRGGGSVAPRGGGSGPLGTGVDILSDTQGVNFQPYIARIMRQIYNQWIELIPEEARPPLSKSGMTQLRITIMADGSIHANDGTHDGLILETSTHDNALNRAAWGSITGVGQFPPLPPQFHGPDLELRIRYLVNKQPE